MDSAHRSAATENHSSQDRIEPLVYVNRVVARSGTSFLWGMKVLPLERRRAMYAIYTFCREVDDIVDKTGEIGGKKQALAAWRREIGRLYAGQPEWPTTMALLRPVQLFDLPQEEFLTVIDGMEIDAAPTVQMQTLADLLEYCRKVAGAVGMLSVHAFGVPARPGPQIAVALGNALQLTNILRDLKEDAASHRLYVPLDLLDRHGVPSDPLEGVFAHPDFAAACGELADMARGYYHETERLLAEIGWRNMRPAVLMMAVYRDLLDRLEKRGWKRLDKPIRVPRSRKMWITLRYGLF